MRKPPEALMPPDESVRLSLRFGDRIVTFTGEDTLVRRFRQGDGVYDHCIYVTPDEQRIAFTPTPEAMQAFLDLGFPVREDEFIDEATIEHYARVQAAHADEEGVA